LTEAGLELGEDDTYTTQPGIGVSEITVQRKQLITIIHGGNTLEVFSYGETVESLLTRLSLILTDQDVVSVPLSTETYDGMQLTITRSVRMEETYTALLPFETTYVYDPALAEGEEKVLTSGADGQVLCTASVTYLDGKEISRTILNQKVIQQPINAIVAVGTYVEQQAPETEPTDPPPTEPPTEPPTQAPTKPRPEVTGKPIIEDGVIITPNGEVLTYTSSLVVKATAYNNQDPGCSKWTATGTLCRVGAIAVDPRVIPYGTRMYIVSNDGRYIYGVAVAEDCGGSIKGNRIDLYFDTVEECNRFGVRNCTVYFLG
jgi:3D (Asp-Asp-Asp) domain-containing protein